MATKYPHKTSNDPKSWKESVEYAVKKYTGGMTDELNKFTSLSSSSKVNSFFLTTLSWLRKLNSAAFFCSLANLFSYLDTFFKVGLTLLKRKNFTFIRKLPWMSQGPGKYSQFSAEVVDLGVKIGDLLIKSKVETKGEILEYWLRFCF